MPNKYGRNRVLFALWNLATLSRARAVLLRDNTAPETIRHGAVRRAANAIRFVPDLIDIGIGSGWGG